MEKIAVSFLKLSAKWEKPPQVIDFVSILTSAKSVLIIMPDNLEEFGTANNFISDIKSEFVNAKFFFLSRKNYQTLLDLDKTDGTIFVTADDINYFGLPKKKLRQKIMAAACDVIIDLNLGFHLLSTLLCYLSKAPMRICFDETNREPFYNFSYRANSERNVEEKYQGLIKYMGIGASIY